MGEAQQRMKGVFPMGELVSRIASGSSSKKEESGATGEEEVLIVDVGGGKGQSLVAIQQELRDEGVEVKGLGSWVLQDRPGVIASIPEEDLPGIKKQAHDFFTPQPIKGTNGFPYFPVVIAVVHTVQEIQANTMKNQQGPKSTTSVAASTITPKNLVSKSFKTQPPP